MQALQHWEGEFGANRATRARARRQSACKKKRVADLAAWTAPQFLLALQHTLSLTLTCFLSVATDAADGGGATAHDMRGRV